MSATDLKNSELAMKELRHLEVSKIDKNPSNPRIHFTEEELERLTESIATEGILVPVVVYEEGDKYFLIDGERRWRCAKALGLETMPAVIAESPDDRQNLLLMFNIHQVREPWADMPTAWALKNLIKITGLEGDRELSDATGLSVERIKRLRHALELPGDYQKYIDDGLIPLNFFWELKRNVIDPLAKYRPKLFEAYQGEDGDGVLKAFVRKRLEGITTDTVSLRKVRPIITAAAREVDDVAEPSILDDTLKTLLDDVEMTIDQAYEDTVEVMVEADKLERRTNNMLKGFERLFTKAKTEDERGHLKNIASNMIGSLKKLIK